MMAAVLALFGVAAIAWAGVDGRFRDHEGFYVTSVAFLWSAGAALAVAAGFARARAWRFAGLLLLFLVGQAASLQLVVATNAIGYQHYFTIDRLVTDAPRIPLLVLALEAVVVGLLLLRRVRDWLDFLRRELGWVQSLIVLAIFAMTSATLSKNPVDYALELVLATTVQAVHLAALVLALEAIPANVLSSLAGAKERLLGPDAVEEGVDPVAIAAAVWTVILASLFCILVYERHPHVPDEVVYMYHGRYFAQGMLTMPLPAAPDAFNVDLMFYEGDVWFCPVPPGWPAALSIGYFLGVPWLVNPALAGGVVLLGHSVVRGIYGRRTARLVTLLVATSPWFLFLAMSFMTHTLALFGAVAAAFGLMKLYRGKSLAWAAGSGAMIGLVSLVRPLEGVAVAGVLGLWALTFGPVAARVIRVGVMAVSTALVGAIALPYNAALTGDPLKFPLMLYTDRLYGEGSNALGFGPNRGLGWTGLDPFPGHGAIDVVVNANLNFFQVATELHGWAIGSLLFVAILLVSRRMRRADWGMLGAVITVIFLHSFYWFSGGPDFGARYWYLIFIPSIVLSARGIEVLGDRLDAGGEHRLHLGVGILCLSCVLSFLPWRAVDKYHHYRFMRADVRSEVLDRDLGNALVIVRGNRHPDYASAVIYNPIDFSEPVPIFAWDRGEVSRREAVEAYPERPVYVLDGPSITGRGYALVGGPYAGAEAVERAIEKLPSNPSKK